jgi:flagellar hook-associated protein 1 FlgK
MSSSLNAILSIAKSGLLSQQLALQVTSNNLANASTEGYSRQRAELVPGTPVLLPQGLLGTGVRVADITRARDVHLDSVYRREATLYNGLTARHRALGSVETAFGELGDASLSASMDAFWNAWSDLSNDPVSTSARVVLVARGQALVDHFHRINASMDALTSQAVDRLRDGVGEVNGILADIADLNADIAQTIARGVSAPELSDRRDLLLDRLASLVPVTVSLGDRGSVGVAINGISVVEGTLHKTLTTQGLGGVWSVQTDSGLTLGITSGEIGGTLTVLNDDFATLRAELGQLAQGIVERVNGIHATGTNPLGATGVNFFDDFGDPSTITAANFALDAAILADSQSVAAGTPDGSGGYQAGENDVALAIAGLRDAVGGGVLAGRSIDEAYRDLAAGLATGVSSAREAQDTHATLLSAALESRESVSGVATDEELIKVVQIQAAYTAASRLVTVVDEMYQALLAI